MVPNVLRDGMFFLDCLTIEDEGTLSVWNTGNCLGSDSRAIPEGLYAEKFVCVENYN